MCSDKVIEFGARVLSADDVAGKDVIEVGSRVVQDPSMTLRHHVESLEPRSYWGIDVIDGYGVDAICSVEGALDEYGEESFDVVIATELLEHVEHWRPAVQTLKRLVKREGVLLVTTRSEGFPYHGWPHDFWRYSLEDFERIFVDMQLEALEPDPKEPGVMMLARKPQTFRERTLHFPLYSVIAGERVLRVGPVRRELFAAVMGGRRAYQRVVPERARQRVNRVLRRA